MRTAALFGLGGLVLGFLGSRLWTTDDEGTHGLVSGHAQTTVRSAEANPTECVASLSAADRRLLERALNHPQAPAALAAGASTLNHDAAEKAERQREAVSEAQELVASAIGAGQWDDQDALAFRELANELEPSQRQAAVSALVRAVNEQRVRVSAQAAPW